MQCYTDATILLMVPMEAILKQLRTANPSLTFAEGNSFHWSPARRTIFYIPENTDKSTWSLLHETAHALLNHTNYDTDLDLMRMEVLAWEQAKHLAQLYDIAIDDEHIEFCLDTYRDWLFARSTCPKCLSASLQSATKRYECFNCKTVWFVSRSRFCRIYRATISK